MLCSGEKRLPHSKETLRRWSQAGRIGQRQTGELFSEIAGVHFVFDLRFDRRGNAFLSNGLPIQISTEERMSFDIVQPFRSQTTLWVLRQKFQNEVFRDFRDMIRDQRLILDDSSIERGETNV